MTVTEPLVWHRVADVDALADGRVMTVTAGRASLALTRFNDRYGALDNHCPHQGGPLGEVADAKYAGRFDTVFILEALHDLSRPVEVLSTLRTACNDGGSVIVMDERVADEFGAIGDPIERFMYAASVLHCLPAGMSEQPSAGTGTVMRVDTVRAYAADAGFAKVDVLPIEHDFFRFYRLVP